MNPDRLKKILDDHKLWLSGQGGARANLQSADLRFANLQFANLQFAKGIITLATGTDWAIAIGITHTRIGCQLHTNEEWESFTDSEIAAMDIAALAFWQSWKPAWQIAVKICVKKYGHLTGTKEQVNT